MTRFPRLFESYALGSLRLKNRIVLLPHGTGMLRAGLSTPDDEAYFAARVAGGVGLVILGGILVHPTAVRRSRKNLEAYDERMLDVMAGKAAFLHQHGVPVIGQLFHTGREMLGEEGLEHAVAPSALRSPRDPYPPHELDTHEIGTLVRAFAESARNLARAGFDGIEIHGAHGYLVTQFLSPETNKRTDAYGGDAVRRFRFLREIIESIRGECPRPFVLGLRLTADEELADGLDIGATTEIAERVAALGLADYLSITIGVRGAYVKDITWPEATAARAARRIRDATGLPIVLGQRITKPSLAESLLCDGSADLIGMARALIADPEWPRKAATRDDVRSIRPCVGLLQDCRNHQPHLHCAVNPRAGREAEADFAHLGAAALRRRVAVIGGGPGGMEAARILAERGHEATLFEEMDTLGGQFLYAAALPRRSGLTAFLDHLQYELRRLSVRVELNARIASPADLGGTFDVVILATGARPRPVPQEQQGPQVCSWFDILEHGVPSPQGSGVAAMVDDGGGFWFTYGVAEHLALAGWRVVVTTPGAAIAANVPHESVGPLLARLGQHDTRYRVLTTIAAIEPGRLRVCNVASGEEETLACDLVVLQTGRQAETGPLAALRAGGLEVRSVGDCVAPRRISHALYEAQRVARTL